MNIQGFRVFYKRSKRMYFPQVISYDASGKITGFIIRKSGEEKDVSKFIVMQSTGVKDKNGREIFEGDIIKGRFYFRGVGAFDSGEGDYEVCDTVVFKNAKFTCRGFDLKDVVNGNVEVIGNIYENPELFEGVKQ